MGLDEAGTLSGVNTSRRELIDPAIAAHSGRVVKPMGDGTLVEFASVVDAVTCAIEIQRQLRERDAGGCGDNPITFRIGIHVGDIIIEGEDILGDGVNTAARIEGFAEPGGITISEDAWRADLKARWPPTSSMPANRASRISAARAHLSVQSCAQGRDRIRCAEATARAV